MKGSLRSILSDNSLAVVDGARETLNSIRKIEGGETEAGVALFMLFDLLRIRMNEAEQWYDELVGRISAESDPEKLMALQYAMDAARGRTHENLELLIRATEFVKIAGGPK